MLDSYLKDSTVKLNDQAVHTLFSVNRWEMMDQLKADLLAGTNIVCDRYAYSGVAYSAAKGLSFSWCQNSDKGLITPDLVVMINVPFEVLAK